MDELDQRVRTLEAERQRCGAVAATQRQPRTGTGVGATGGSGPATDVHAALDELIAVLAWLLADDDRRKGNR